jgi:hypothetical protein
LLLESGSTFEINDGAILLIKAGSTFQVKSGANLIVKGSGSVVVESGGNICVENGATLNLQDALSAINLHTGYTLGVNANVVANPGTCASVVSAIVYSGNGSINQFNNDVIIQNQKINYYNNGILIQSIPLTGSKYVAGTNKSVGSNITTANPPGPGPVTIQNGTSVILNAEGNILLDKGFEVQLGAGFEVKNQ